VLELLKKRRSIRKYQDKKIEKEKIDALIKGALVSPSSKNNRPWEFIVVTDEEILEKLSQSKHGAQMLKGAPLGIVVLADPNKSDVWVEDASIASTNIIITAESLGLGSCWVQIRNRMYSPDKTAEEYVKEILDIPEEFRVLSIISIGYPDEVKAPHKEENLLYERVHYNKF